MIRTYHTGPRAECEALQSADDARAGRPAVLGVQTDGGFHRPLARVVDGEIVGDVGVSLHVRGLRRHPTRDEYAYEVPAQLDGESQSDYVARLRSLYPDQPPGLSLKLANVGELPGDYQ
jgi:hypothetical protein